MTQTSQLNVADMSQTAANCGSESADPVPTHDEDVRQPVTVESDQPQPRPAFSAPSTDPSSPVTLDSIVQLVAQRLNADPQKLVVRGRHGNRGREAAIVLAREFTTEPLRVLGKRFGGVAPSAICEVVRRAQQHQEADPAFAQFIQNLRDELTRGRGASL
jgi:hypothetical protein